MNETMEIDLRELLRACVRRVWLIVACAVVAGVAVCVYTALFITPMYQTGATFYVNNSVSGEGTSITSADLTTSQKLVATYINIIKSDTVLEKVADETGMDITPEYLRSIMTASALGSTEMFTVKISHSDPQKAADIANAVATVAPDAISDIVVGSATKVIDYAKVPGSPSSPNLTKNAALGTIAGAVLAVVFVVVQTLLDVRIKSEDDLAKISNAPVLGVIPDFSTEGKHDYVSYGSKKKPTKTVRR